MIIQTASPGQPHFVITQIDHARVSGDLARAFGNADFAPLAPREAMEFVAAHHDEGWDVVDVKATRDPRTGLIHHLTQTPIPDLVLTGSRSPDFNEAHHPYSGLISSMHTYGLWNGRYGLSDKIFINVLPDELRPTVAAMLDGELTRQANLRDLLADDPSLAAWVTQEGTFHNYKLLQFFDTLALYFHMTHAAARGESRFVNVPRALGDDATLIVHPLGNGVYALDPWPFAGDDLVLSTRGRFMRPEPEDADLKRLFDEAEVVEERVKLMRHEP